MEHIPTILICLVLAALIVLALVKVIRTAKSGGCGCGCKGCSHAAGGCCHADKQKTGHISFLKKPCI